MNAGWIVVIVLACLLASALLIGSAELAEFWRRGDDG